MDVAQSECVRPPSGFYGTRSRAFEFRDQIERQLESSSEKVVISFDGVSATQSFVDELVGVLVVQHGAAVTKRLTFRNCSDEMKGLIRFVLNDRIEQVEGTGSTPEA